MRRGQSVVRSQPRVVLLAVHNSVRSCRELQHRNGHVNALDTTFRTYNRHSIRSLYCPVQIAAKTVNLLEKYPEQFSLFCVLNLLLAAGFTAYHVARFMGENFRTKSDRVSNCLVSREFQSPRARFSSILVVPLALHQVPLFTHYLLLDASLCSTDDDDCRVLMSNQ